MKMTIACLIYTRDHPLTTPTPTHATVLTERAIQNPDFQTRGYNVDINLRQIPYRINESPLHEASGRGRGWG